MKEEVENYLYFIKAVSNVCDSSLEVYTREIRKFFSFLHTINYNIGQKEILKYLEHLKQYKRSTASRKIAIIKSFYKYLEVQEKIPISPFHKIYRMIKPGNNDQKQQTNPPIFTKEQINKLLSPEATVSQMSFEQLRNEVIVRLFLATGMRRKELLDLKTINIDDDTILIRPETSKRKKERVVFFDSITNRWLKWYMSRRKSRRKYRDKRKKDKRYDELSPYLLISDTGRRIGLGTLRRIIEDKFEKIGLGRKFKCHLFRHTCATILLEHGAEPKAVQDLLGHKHIATTFDTYTHLSQEYLKKVYKKANPFKDFGIQQDVVVRKSVVKKEDIKFDDGV